MSQQVLGRYDPTGRRATGVFQKVQLDEEGRPLVWRFDETESGFRVRVLGTHAERALREFLDQVPPADGCTEFTPSDPLLRRLASLYGGLRLFRVPWAFDIAAGVVLQQRVRWSVAYNDFRRVACRWGTPVAGAVAFPTARELAAVPVAAIEALNIDPKRARALSVLARREAAHPFLSAEPDIDRLTRRLLQLPGIGPWTANMIAGYACGDPDAVPTGDLHLPSLVTNALAGEEEGTDERMVELLEPYRGQRFRVIRLLSWASRRAPQLIARAATQARRTPA